MIVGSQVRPAGWPGVLAVVAATVLTTTACSSSPQSAPVSPAPVPDVIFPGWRQPGDLDIHFTVHKPQAARTFQVHAVLTVDAAGRVSAMRTAQSSDGVVALRTEWDGGQETTTTRTPDCAPAAEPAQPPDSVADWLAEPFGPVDASTADGWTVAGDAATRPGSTAETLERAPLTALANRVVSEVDRNSGAVVTEVRDITVVHAKNATPPPACGAPWPQ